jgi:chromosome segregation ATPase
MTYLIAQIWLFIAVAAAVGLLFGWMFRGGVSGARVRELRHGLAHAQAEAAEQRREAAELAARAERRGHGGGSADVAHFQLELRAAKERASRFEAEAREAVSAADRYSEEAEELRQRIAELTSRGGGAGADERAAWRERVTELEQEADSLRRRLEQRTSEAADALRARIVELEAEVETMQDRIAVLQEGADAGASAGAADDARAAEREARIGELEADRDLLRARIEELEARLEAGPSTNGSGAHDQELETLRAEAERLRAAASDRDTDSGEMQAMRTRIGTLQADLELSRNRAAEAEALASAVQSDGGGRVASAGANGMEEVRTESARLKWRNSYLTSRIHFLESKLSGQAPAQDEDAADAEVDGALAAARAEVARLSARVEELERAAIPDKSGQPAPNVEGGGGSLEWRNRYLASRVRYLEQQLEQRDQAAPATSEDELRFKLAQAEEKLKDASKMRARVAELERSAEQAASEDDGGAKGEVLRALEWRVRYLSSRVKYLEDRLVKSEARSESEPSDAG